MIVALLLAGGMGRRFGGDKLTADAGGMPLVRRTAEALLQTSADRVLVVTGHDADGVRAALAGLDVGFVHAPDFAEGMGASLRAGIAALPHGASHALVVLGDQPGASHRSVVEPVLAAARARDAAIVSVRYRDLTAPPVAFASALFGELRALDGDAGARKVVERDASRVRYVELDTDAPVDVDTRDDMARLTGTGSGVAVLAGAEHVRLDGDGVKLHAVAMGSGPPVLLLHGFPDFWFTWRLQMPALAAAGFRVVALDMRGYAGSGRPKGVSAYTMPRLVADVAAVIRQLGGRAHLAGHDWGGVVAWNVASRAPGLLDSLVVLNAPHPARFTQALRTPRQLARSWYAIFFQLPWLPELLLSVADHELLLRALPPMRPAELALYREALSQPGALTAMLNYYRAAARSVIRGAASEQREASRTSPRTLLLWGDRDPYLGQELTEGLTRWVPELRVERIASAGHWVHLDAPDVVNGALVRFLRAQP